ncbi:MAG: Tyrosine-tRNA ligase [Candidatus Kaiserbacteria bacterium GW2011_GWC2_49_12]|uniref:Tyrosine--tRNA ligase n=5 Tax=Candidatus Kaiseribacteriota TaxID=1752734 RepID=A0A0G1WEV0_9BACT|nr:MAG: Tyrosine-tRNA ligase [Candidatus Kaiserbacteria bacterium GW2011_GWC2_49_12]KKW09275.1 MAG: Tyrosine-tRNA ligase [Candidatus Kaiserbacteria bacterium GW2011_GWA2_49_56]KKW17308.1 MAG: Tyrosine-tRNA ligase [Candidatus Kaiserbacteria bacterium GW2011_GWB1_50_17]KKW18174.1 MAG: Tyrosine-tRNA ligase [Candidatus Kaiserbacteria bacterium GW2011_GWA1_50_28]OGG88504.1 MAG: tyrosine--tRNA ligase [Candidatus Kaiserbacteria bacterium RIFCSPLOWO2_12_FULL_50_28]
MSKLSETLKKRGYVQQFSSKKLEEITDGKKRTLYLGIDPSADSLQVGQLQAFLILRRFLEDGHKVILLVGGGTGLIGDPGGKSVERPLLESETVSANAEKIAEQARRLFSGADFTLLNNTEWLEKLNIIEFLRDTGKHFTVNMMLQRDFIKDRIKNPEEGISYTEFSYALLQAYDYFHLHQEYGCDVQVGGSDQWGNIVSGVDFIRRKTGDVVYALTWPLLVNKATGKKFGKSEMGTIWLSPEKTTPFQFYQFWFNTEDEAVREYLLKMTMLSETEIDAAMELHKREPRRRHAQGILAQEITSLVHGESTAEAAERVSRAIFDENLAELSPEDITNLREVAPSYEAKIDDSLIDVLVGAQLASSKREARQFLAEKAITLNGKIVKSERELVEKDFSESLAILKRGKRNVCILILV